MKKATITRMTICAMVAFALGTMAIADMAEARAGGSRSVGSRGSRSYSKPAAPSTRPSPQVAPTPTPMTPPPYQAPQPAGGGFLRSMAGGLVGGMLGGMLFRGMGYGGYGPGGVGGSGIGLFEILLIGGIIYFIYRMVSRRRQQESVYQGTYQYQSQEPAVIYNEPPPVSITYDDVATGLQHVRQMDPGFDEQRFTDTVMDIFFKIQGAWMNRDLGPVSHLLAPKIKEALQSDVERLLRERKTNRLENIAVRKVEIVEVWQESGQDFITSLIYANLLDYTTEDATGQVIEGSKTEPVKFEEYWTMTRPVGNTPWQLTAIDQK